MTLVHHNIFQVHLIINKSNLTISFGTKLLSFSFYRQKKKKKKEKLITILRTESEIGMFAFPDHKIRLCSLYESASQTAQLIGKSGMPLLNQNWLFYWFLGVCFHLRMSWIINQIQSWHVSNVLNRFVEICVQVAYTHFPFWWHYLYFGGELCTMTAPLGHFALRLQNGVSVS